jgi:hypothetical protein
LGAGLTTLHSKKSIVEKAQETASQTTLQGYKNGMAAENV